ncbi:MAG: hypothetical protein HYV41_05570 [Candidatus Magasanikbacteria bacterium]|nr:hypothetical protein [Candidatus Magasanikbacteria bacterium]
MFKKKQKIQEEKADPSVSIQKIPNVFYGGQDPEIYHDKGVDKSGVRQNTRIKFEKQSTNVSFFVRKRIWIVGGLVFLLSMSGVTWYYISPYLAVQKSIKPVDTSLVFVPKEVVVTSTSEVATTTIDVAEEPTSTIQLSDPFSIDFPPLLTLNTVDLDADELTDIEEGLFNTDSGTWDTDGDVYYDGQEIFNLYNPKGFAPVKLIDSGLVQEYSSTHGYRIYHPFSWQFGEVDIKQKQVLFSAISGEYVEVRVFDKEHGENFISWFASHAKGQRYTDLVEFTNRFKEKGLRRSDHLVAYFEIDATVFVILYHQKDLGPVPYRNVVKMMYQSFRPQKTDVEIPDQEAFGGATSTVLLDGATSTVPVDGVTSTLVTQ